MRYSLLDLTQRILDSMESDEVSTINETSESATVANIIKECYFDIVGYSEGAEFEGLFKLDASTDNTKPALMLVPQNVMRVDWIKYNHNTLDKPEYDHLRFVSNEEYIYMNSSAEESDTSFMSIPINGSNFVFRYWNDRSPSYYTIFDERFIVFDSYDSTKETTLTNARSMAYGLVIPTFTMADDFIPDLDPRQFQLLLQDAKATAHVELKQAQNPKAEKKYRENRILSQKTRNDNTPGSSRQETYLFGRRRRY